LGSAWLNLGAGRLAEDERKALESSANSESNQNADSKSDDSAVGRKVLRQTGAFAVLRTLSSLLNWAGVILLSRILDPRAFGAFEIGFFWIGLGQLIGDGGLAASLVRHRGELTRRHYQVATSFALAVATAMGACFYFAIPLIGSHSDLSTAEMGALRAMSPLYVLPVLRMVPYVKLEREINFAVIGRIELIANAIRYTVAIVVALLVDSVWALIASQMALTLAQVGGAYYTRPGWPGIGWDSTIFRSLFAYGSKVQLGNVFLYMKNNVGRGLLGFWLGSAAVGVFGFGLGLVNVPSDAVNGLARVQFPAYARLRQDDPELYGLVRGAMRGSLLVGLPILGALVTAADWTIPFVYSDKWLPAVPLTWALVPHIAAELLAMHLITFVQGQGRAGLALLVYGVWSCAMWLFVLTALVLGEGNLTIIGLAYGVATVCAVVALITWVSRYLGRALVRDVLGPLLAAALGFATSWMVRQSLASDTLLAVLACLGSFLGSYALVLFAWEGRVVLDDLRRTVRALRR